MKIVVKAHKRKGKMVKSHMREMDFSGPLKLKTRKHREAVLGKAEPKYGPTSDYAKRRRAKRSPLKPKKR